MQPEIKNAAPSVNRRRVPRWALRALLVGTLACGMAPHANPASLDIQINPTVTGEPLQPSSLRYETSAGERYSITRVSYLLSGFALQRTDGTWLEFTNVVAWLDQEEKRNAVQVGSIPPDEYVSVRYRVGLSPALNHLDPASIPARSPLNPALNNLHWSWQGGFIFLALEGLWRNDRGEMDGWAYHLARDTNAVLVTLPAALDLRTNAQMQVDFDLAALLNSPRPLSFARDGSSTHSRDGDAVAATLVRNLASAFRVRSITVSRGAEPGEIASKPRYLPAKFTPYAFRVSSTFPLPELPRDNPLLAERMELGKKLFFDPQLSTNSQQSCASCHAPAKAFSDSRRFSRGATGSEGTRNAMPLFNLAWKKTFFWDGRAATLRQQTLQPIQNPLEMHHSLDGVIATLKAMTNADYASAFVAAFETPEITAEKISLALENYLLTLTSFDAKFDRVQRGEAKFTAEEQRGFELFSTEYDPRRGQLGADCFHCHGGSLFRSQNFANNGLDETFSDAGLAGTTGKTTDAGKFSVPSLRNAELTAPYMHDGRFATLDEVIEHYATGVKRSNTLDPNLAKHPDGGVPLSAADKQALVAFLKTLTEESLRPRAETNSIIITARNSP